MQTLAQFRVRLIPFGCLSYTLAFPPFLPVHLYAPRFYRVILKGDLYYDPYGSVRSCTNQAEETEPLFKKMEDKKMSTKWKP